MVPGGKASEGERPESEYILMLLQCTAGILTMFLPGFLSKSSALRYRSNVYFVRRFLFCAIYLVKYELSSTSSNTGMCCCME